MRSISDIAREISSLWKNVHYSAKPYLDAMWQLHKIDDMYGMDSADSIVRYFLGNARTWKGEDARRIKKELKSMLN